MAVDPSVVGRHAIDQLCCLLTLADEAAAGVWSAEQMAEQVTAIVGGVHDGLWLDVLRLTTAAEASTTGDPDSTA
jgi:hypothetical protein